MASTLVVPFLTSFISICMAQINSVEGCLCVENILECSNMHFTELPEFSEFIKLSTQKILLRNIPNLDLSSMKCAQWPNLVEINLTGKFFSKKKTVSIK